MKYCFILLIPIQLALGQSRYPQDYFINPLDITTVLSGTFGELRNNHFHSGLDIKTQQVEGMKVYAVADGYVSRIKIAHYGYGKALYITHPNGYVSVYAHLQKLEPKLETYLKNIQYERGTYEIELFPQADELIVSQGDIIAFSGNTGSSGGPHLHFEIRDNLERPINPLLFGIDVKDTKPPTIQKFYAYPKDANSFINGKNERTELRLIPRGNANFEVEPLTAYGYIGFGVTTYDQQDLAANKNGVSNITTTVNGIKNFEIDFKRFSFDETSHLNRLVDYEFYKTNRSFVKKLFVEPNNPLSMYKDVIDNGYLKVEDSINNIYKIVVSDFHGNTSTVSVKVKGDKPEEKLQKIIARPYHHFIYANDATTLEDQHVSVYIPDNTFYDDVNLDFRVSGDTLHLHQDVIPLQKNIGINYDISQYQDGDKNKLFVGKITGYRKYINYIPTIKKGDLLTAYTKTLGQFILKADEKAPSVTPVNFQNGKWLSNYRYLKVKISDDLSGIGSYRATVNDKFILMEYDYKTGVLTHDFNDNVVTDTRNELKIIVTDNVGNNTTFEATFFRK
ncbi:M23 family metallopeptidase [Paucihalobacter sp.]|uniref:M23 family metallopeptidase n=1 Tax=Paucihalobacter sp. TaxID=2850405 RepID=UPI003D1610AD